MARAIPVAAGTVDVQLDTGKGNLRGFSIHESAGTPAVASFFLRDGTSASGAILAVIELTADSSQTNVFAESIDYQTGLFLDRIAGNTEGAVYVE